MKKKNAKPPITEAQKSEINHAAARTLSRLKKETCLAPPNSISIEEWRECRDIISEEMAKIAFIDSDSKFYRDILEQIAGDNRRTRARCLAASGIAFIDSVKEEAAKRDSKLSKLIRMRDTEGNLVQHGDRIRFNYGTPIITVTAKVVQRRSQLIALTPRHSPKECSLRDLRKFVVNFYKV